MTGVRWREEIEGQCEACLDWWPLTGRFWMRNSGLRRCAACIRERRAIATPEECAKAEARRAYNREWMRRYRSVDNFCGQVDRQDGAA